MERYQENTKYRRSIRLPGYDYSKIGMYFVTICTKNRECLFGKIVDDTMQKNILGQIVTNEWLKTSVIRLEVQLLEFVVMPNHFHGIIHIVDSFDDSNVATLKNQGDQPVAPTEGPSELNQAKGPRACCIGALIAGFKSAVTTQINTIRHSKRTMIWQRNYYEHVIRDDADYHRLAEYINTNPQRWNKDRFYKAAPLK